MKWGEPIWREVHRMSSDNNRVSSPVCLAVCIRLLAGVLWGHLVYAVHGHSLGQQLARVSQLQVGVVVGHSLPGHGSQGGNSQPGGEYLHKGYGH